MQKRKNFPAHFRAGKFFHFYFEKRIICLLTLYIRCKPNRETDSQAQHRRHARRKQQGGAGAKRLTAALNRTRQAQPPHAAQAAAQSAAYTVCTVFASGLHHANGKHRPKPAAWQSGLPTGKPQAQRLAIPYGELIARRLCT